MSEEPGHSRRKRRTDEKGEKAEKEHEKQDEKEGKNWEEKWQRDPIRIGTWAAILIWIGLALLLGNLDLLGGARSWSTVFIGIGVILLANAAIRFLIPEHRQPIAGIIIAGAIFLGIGLGGLVSWSIIGPVILIAIGLAMLLRGFGRRRNE
ncbi:MAG: LiaF transmembrane domain-containing protein [Dehalococcoidia bacterium]